MVQGVVITFQTSQLFNMPKDNQFTIRLKNFSAGYAPLAFSDSLVESGGEGHASVMQNVSVSDGKLTQGPGLSNLTNGTQSGNVTELINFILDRATSDNVGWAIGVTKLFKLSSTAVTSGTAISGCTDGESLVALKGNLYGFYNKSSGGDIFKMPLTSESITASWGSTTPSGAAALQNAIHPSAAKEDIIVFGNGQYAGVYIVENNTLDVDKLDFGSGTVVSDVVFNNGYWWLAVNSGVTGTNRTDSQIYLYDGAAIVSTLSDETFVGVQRIGFLYVIEGVVYVAYQDLTASGFIIGYISGKAVKPLVRFSGTLPTFAQKTLYKNTILFLSSALVFSAGAFVPELPYALSQIADGGYATVGAIAAPFGTPMVSSTDGGSNHRLALFSGYETASLWKSIVFPVSAGKVKGFLDDITVLTNTLGSGASCSMTIEYDQAASTSSAKTITTTGKRRHYFNNFGMNGVEDFRVAFDWSAGSTSNPVTIREVVINGHYIETAF